MKVKVIVNTNRIIAALIKDSVSRKIIYHGTVEMLGINFSLKEIEKYGAYIIKKAGITEQEFEKILQAICDKIIFINDSLVDIFIEEGKELMSSIDPDDVPFIAAALATGADIWSDDPHFTRQNKIKVWKTAELAKLL